MAVDVMIASTDLPVGFELGPVVSSVPPDDEDPASCDGFSVLNERYGEAAASWGIDYASDGTHSEDLLEREASDSFTVSQRIFVWQQPIAVQRTKDALSIASICFPERVEVNARRNTGGGPAEFLPPVSSEPLAFNVPSDKAVAGVRVTFTLEESGLSYPVYYDFIYVADRRITVVFEMRRVVVPAEAEVERALVNMTLGRLDAVQ